MTALPAWLKQALVNQGVMGEGGMTRRAKVMRHPPCGIPCMAGFDSQRAALDAWCDLTELSAQGEVEALIAGRGTYELWGAKTPRPTLEQRDRWRIGGAPAGSHLANPVLASHDCGSPVPAAWAAPVAADTAPASVQDGLFPF
jgi:hypothetical protein